MMELVGEVSAVSKSNEFFNIVVKDNSGNLTNVKINDLGDIKIGNIYKFILNKKEGERVSYSVISYISIDNFTLENKDKYLRDFYKKSPLSLEEEIKELKNYLSKIENKVIYDITNTLMNRYYVDFLTYPAASKMHHAYVGGLAYHTIGMLKLAESLKANYPYLKSDYLYAGVILHDIGKTKELSGNGDITYTLEGQLLGHLVIGAMEINEVAKELGYQDKEEVLILEHMVVSHHGIPQYGSCRKPQTAEAMALWFIDTIDSKFRLLGERLEQTPIGEWTDTIAVLEKSKIYNF